MTNNRNLEALKDLISSARSNKFSSLRKIVQDDSDVYEIWDMVSQWIEFNMQRHKAVNVSGFGCFTFTSKELDIGYKRYIVVQRPVFILSEKLISIHRLNQPKYLVPGEIPVTQLNFIALAHELDISRDVVEASVKEIIQAFSRKIDKCGGAEFPFTTIGNLVVHNGQAKMKFLPSFLDNMDKTGGLVKYFTNRPETSDSILEGVETLPQVLPRIEPGGDIDLARTESRGCVVDETKPESKATTRGDQQVPIDEKTGSPALQRKKEAITATLKTGSVSAPEPQVISKVTTPRSSMKGRCGGVVFNDPRFANTTPSQEPIKLENITECTDDIEKDIPKHRLGTPERITKSLDTATAPGSKTSINSSPHINDMNNIGRLTPPRVKTRRLSLDNPVTQSAPSSTCQQTRVKSDGHRRGGASKKSCTESCTPSKCDNCATKNTDFCYLCFQREKRNVPVYFAEQRKQKEAEEDRLLQMYQHLRDSESLTKEAHKKEHKREESQQIAAFNLGVAEAIKAREDERPTDYHRSFVFYKRPVTPPLWVKLEEDLAKQVTEKQHKRIKEKHDRDCLERLEQMQLAEDLGAQRNHYLTGKKMQSEEYRKALDTQVYIRQCLTERDNDHRLLSSATSSQRGMSVPRPNIVLPFQKEVPVRLNRASATRLIHYRTSQLPAAEPDSDGPIFGVHDSTMEKERNRRKCARELYESQVKMATGKKYRMENEDTQRRTEEDKMLKQTRAELITECCHRNERNIKQRKNLERSWATNAAMKHARERHELDRTRSPGLLLLEQCESYDRCAQCCRKSKNCGESNVWSESRYVAGSRLIV